MPRFDGRGSSKILLILCAVILLFGFTPISRALLNLADGSFAPTPYSSLALLTPSIATGGVPTGEAIPVQLTNHTGHVKTYHWNATQHGALISLGEDTLAPGRAVTIYVPSRSAVTGKLRIALAGTRVFVTVPVVKS
jgi:hypothetical protein